MNQQQDVVPPIINLLEECYQRQIAIEAKEHLRVLTTYYVGKDAWDEIHLRHFAGTAYQTHGFEMVDHPRFKGLTYKGGLIIPVPLPAWFDVNYRLIPLDEKPSNVKQGNVDLNNVVNFPHKKPI